MQILPINFNLSINQQKIQSIKSGNNMLPIAPKLKPLSVDTVSFTSAAPYAEPLRRLLPYKIPDLYSEVILVDNDAVRKMLDKGMFNGTLRSISKMLKPYKDSFFPVEKEFYYLLRNEAKHNPKLRLDEFVQKLVPKHSQLLLHAQKPVFDELTRLSKQMPGDLLEEFNYLMYVTNKKLYAEPVYVPFSVKEFKYKLGRIRDRINNSKNNDQRSIMNKIIKIASSVQDIPKEKRLQPSFPIKKYERKQKEMVWEIANYVEKTSLRSDKDIQELLNLSKAKIYKTPTNIKFNRKSFIYDLQEILNKLSDRKLANEMNKVAVSLPTSKENISAFIMKSANRSSSQIGYDMFQGSLGCVDHLKAAHKGGSDCLENYALSSTYMNSKKAHTRFAVLLRKDPKIAVYSQRQVDRLIELANNGVFDKVGLSKNYIYELTNRIEKLSSKETPLILDVNALK